jgi:hypothetical protein
MIPSTTIAMMASITAPSRPKMNQPIRNAITAPNPIAPQFTDTMFHHLLFKIPLRLIFVTGDKGFPCLTDSSEIEPGKKSGSARFFPAPSHYLFPS